MRIIITGATGSLGAYLTRYFSRQGHEVIASGRVAQPPAALLQYARYHQADLAGDFSLPEADVCIHTAALADDKASYQQMYAPNVLGTERVARASAHCETFVQISSTSVYLPGSAPINEEMVPRDRIKALSDYGRSKLDAEDMLLRMSQHPRCFILRPRVLYGIGDKVILPRMLKSVNKGKLTYPGKMDNRVSLTHYDNLIQAIECCLASPKQGAQIYNVADAQPYTLGEVIRATTTQLYGHPLPEKQVPIWLVRILALLKIGGITPLLIRNFTEDMIIDTTRIQTELGYQPQQDYLSALPGMARWVQEIGGIEAIERAEKELAWRTGKAE